MTKFYTFFLTALFTIVIQAQTYEFSISYLGINSSTDNYQIALIATPSSTVTNESTDDMGAGFYLPSGSTVGNFETGNSNIPGSEWSSTSLSNTSNAFFISRVEAGSSSVLLNGPDPFELVKFDIIADPNPTSGEIIFIENSDPVFNELLFTENYINISAINKYAQNDPIAKSINFATLRTKDAFINDFFVYPSPTKEKVFIKGITSKLNAVNIYSITGEQVMTVKANLDEINLSRLKSGIYFIKLNSENASKTFKIIKE